MRRRYGHRLPAALDAQQTRQWHLGSKISDPFFAEYFPFDLVIENIALRSLPGVLAEKHGRSTPNWEPVARLLPPLCIYEIEKADPFDESFIDQKIVGPLLLTPALPLLILSVPRQTPIYYLQCLQNAAGSAMTTSRPTGRATSSVLSGRVVLLTCR